MPQIVFAGFGTGLALIMAVGAQNAFVLRQAIRGEHVLPLVLIGIVSDIVAIAAGVAGLGTLLDHWPAVLPIAKMVGGSYLLLFGLRAAWRAWRPGVLSAAGGPAMTLAGALITMLALTWLNPHFYLDTMLMLGAVANSFGDQRWWFFAGTVVASTLWFPMLGYGARLLRGFFSRPSSWRALDSGIAVLMGVLGVSLLTR